MARHSDSGAPLTTSCDLCGSPGGHLLFTATDHREGLGGRFGLVQCDTCRLVRTDPRPQDLSSWYPPDYRSHAGERSAHARASTAALRYAARSHHSPPIARILTWTIPAADIGPAVPPGSTILDVGAGSGAAVAALRAEGYDAWGVEPSASAVAIAHAAGRDTVVQGTLEASELAARKWDVVRFTHVLEHVPSPLTTLRVVSEVLAPGGHVVVVVPNFAGAGRLAFRASWDALEVPRHLHHFTPATLSHAFAAAGLRVRSLRTAALFGSLPASIDAWTCRGRRQRGWSRSLAAKGVTYPLELALAALGIGDGLVAIGETAR
jgi:2-polyprenyl-3-methyl-5-hydroxy-6-metoxy-1,4-benzoquinol methylase